MLYEAIQNFPATFQWISLSSACQTRRKRISENIKESWKNHEQICVNKPLKLGEIEWNWTELDIY